MGILEGGGGNIEVWYYMFKSKVSNLNDPVFLHLSEHVMGLQGEKRGGHGR